LFDLNKLNYFKRTWFLLW